MTTTEQHFTASTCRGCGVKLQMEHPQLPGFVPKQASDKPSSICQRCFRIKHYNESSHAGINPQQFLQIVGQIGQEEALVVHIVDLFDFEGSLISALGRFIGSNPVLLVVNKIDLLPKVTHWNKVRNWVQQQAKQQGIRTVDVVLCSAKDNKGFEQVLQKMVQFRRGKSIYVVGATNVGKSTWINRLIRNYSDMEQELTTSRYPGTTLDVIHIPLDDGQYVKDTPGIVYPSRLSERVSPKDLALIMPDKPIKPVVYQLKERQSIFFGGMARFDFLEGHPQSFTLYSSNRLKFHRTKLDRADTLYQEHIGTLLQPPTKEDVEALQPWTRHQWKIEGDCPVDIFISGLGWIKINDSTSRPVVSVHVPKGIKVGIRPSLI